jgi:hypothetical protein
MKRLTLLLIILPYAAMSQNFHFSARLGIATYNGDLKASSLSLSQSRFMGSLGVRYDLTEHIALRSYLSLGGLKADDKKGSDAMKLRNLNFKSSIFEWEAGIHYSILDLNYHWWTPFVSAGIGLFHFNPKTVDENGNKVKLQPLATEGQGVVQGVKPYKLTQFNIPISVGVERMLNEDMRVGLELGYRKCFTDYLDDVSGLYADQAVLLAAKGQQSVDLAYRGDEVGAGPYPGAGAVRGNSDNKDGYLFINLNFTLRFYFDKYKQIAGLPSSKRSKKVGCPASRY